MNPYVKPYHQIYSIGDDRSLFIGRGMEKVTITNPEHRFEEFLIALNGGASVEELNKQFPASEQWISMLDEAGVIEWQDGNDGYAIVNENHPLNRYSRQIFHIGLYGHSIGDAIAFQEKICRSRIALLGVGAGGTTLGRFLSTAGFGFLRVVDFDRIETANLATHVIINESDVGLKKIDVINNSIKANNSSTVVETHEAKINQPSDIVPYIQDCDFVFQAFDKPIGQVQRWVNEACIASNKPYASIGQTDKSGRVGNIVVAGVTACSDCVGTPDIHVLREHIAAPLTGALVAVLAGILTHEVGKFVSGYAEPAILGKTLLVDSETWDIHPVRHDRNPNCSTCGNSA